MKTIPPPEEFHEIGLRISLGGKDFPRAKEHLETAIQGFTDRGELLNVGRVKRDLARVHAGLGDVVLRDAAIDDALSMHQDISGLCPGDNTAMVELAASYHVAARIELARSAEASKRASRKKHRDAMKGDWREGYDLLVSAPLGHLDYRQQLVAHASISFAALGGVHDLGFLKELYEDDSLDASKHLDADKDRVKAVMSVPKILAARLTPLSPLVRHKVVEKVAGPYIVKVK